MNNRESKKIAATTTMALLFRLFFAVSSVLGEALRPSRERYADAR